MAVDVGAGFSMHEDAEAYKGEGDGGAIETSSLRAPLERTLAINCSE